MMRDCTTATVTLTAILAVLGIIPNQGVRAGQSSQMLRTDGVVRDSQGTLLGGVRIGVLSVGQGEATSDIDGRFAVVWKRPESIPIGTPFYLVARHESRNLAAVTEIFDGADIPDVKLRPGVILTGRVVDPNGKGIPQARVSPILRTSRWSDPVCQDACRTDPNGRFEVRALPGRHEYDVYIVADGFGCKRCEDIDVNNVTNDRLDMGAVTLPPASLRVSGRTVDVEGRPVAGASLSVYGDGQPEGVRARADAEGRFTLQGVCAGPVNIEATVASAGRRLSAFALTEAGSADIKIVLREGSASIIQRTGGKTCEQILATAGKVIAGKAVDEKGAPVADVPVHINCRKTVSNGGPAWTFSHFPQLSATTDAQGRFAIEIEEDGEYNLVFSPDKLAAIVVYDVPVGKKDLAVTLPEGGTVIGRLLRIEKGRKVPIPQAEVKIEQVSRYSFSHLGFDQDRRVVTDSEGRFRVEHLSTRSLADLGESVYVPRLWRAVYEGASETIVFDTGDLIEDFELVVRPDPAKTPPLLGKPLPGFDGIRIELPPDAFKDKRALICFFDRQQRPSRTCVTSLAKQADSLKAKGVAIAAVSISAGDEAALRTWVKENRIPFPVGVIEGDKDEVLAAWSVKSLPWLILSDTSHSVTAEGFTLAELPLKLDEKPAPKP